MEGLGSGLMLLGIALAYLAQIVGAIFVFRASTLKRVLSLLIPGYSLFALKRQGLYRFLVGAWIVGILGLVGGTVILS